jgi:hypothetical protein
MSGTPRRRVKRWGAALLVAVAVVGAGLVGLDKRSAFAGQDADVSRANAELVGVWLGDTADTAPYRDHLVTFHSDGTLDITNPTNVQQEAPGYGAGTTDSKGSGQWRWDAKRHAVVWWFLELNSDAISHQPAESTKIVFVTPFVGDRLVGNWAGGGHTGTITLNRLGVTEQEIDAVPSL